MDKYLYVLRYTDIVYVFVLMFSTVIVIYPVVFRPSFRDSGKVKRFLFFTLFIFL